MVFENKERLVVRKTMFFYNFPPLTYIERREPALFVSKKHSGFSNSSKVYWKNKGRIKIDYHSHYHNNDNGSDVYDDVFYGGLSLMKNRSMKSFLMMMSLMKSCLMTTMSYSMMSYLMMSLNDVTLYIIILILIFKNI